MQTFRAYLRDDRGEITWASWIEAVDRPAAEAAARRLSPDRSPTVDLWSETERRLSPTAVLDAV